MASWKDIPLDADLQLNIADAALRRDHSAVENCYRNDVSGVTRFPGLKRTYDISQGKVYLTKYRGDMMALTDKGQLWRIGRDGTMTNVTGVVVAGPFRPVFDRTDDDQLVIAKGGKIIHYDGKTTDVLSENAPDGATHIAYFKGYLIANERFSGRWFISGVGQYRDWDPLDVFTAESRPDDLVAIKVSPRNELLLAGSDSVERWDLLASGTQPLYRVGTSPEGLIAPYTFLATRDGNFGVNQLSEFVQFLDQVTRDVSDRVQQALDSIDNWEDAWADQIIFDNQNWYLLQAPKATNDYGTLGVTLVFQKTTGKWFQLYDWDESIGLPTRWPGWSYLKIWGRHFIGGEGCVYELLPSWRYNDDRVQRMRLLSAHYDESGGKIEIQDSRLRLRRGLMDVNATVEPRISVRINRDNQGLSGAIDKSLGAAGQTHQVVVFGALGVAETFQFEFMVTDDVPVDVVRFEINRIIL